MIAEKPILRKEGEYFVVSSMIRTKNKNYEVWYKSKSKMNPDINSYLIASILPSMKSDEDLKIEGVVSERLYHSMDKIQNTFSSWFSDLKKVKIISDTKPSYLNSKKAVALSFFTAGVDSSYTLLKNHKKIKKIIFVHGFDIGLNQTEYYLEVRNSIRKIAKKFNKELIEVETNLRSFSNDFVDWEKYFVSGLASVSMLFCGNRNSVYIGGDNVQITRPDNVRVGSHPELDNLWSTESMEVISHGHEIDRMGKIVEICKSNILFNSLRVCWESGEYNCSKCEKCIRTMVPLYSIGFLSKCKSFDNPSDSELIKRIRSLKIKKMSDYLFAKSNFDILKEGKIKSAFSEIINEYQGE